MLLSAHARIPTAWSHPADGLYRATTTHLTVTYRRNMRLLTPAKVRRGGRMKSRGGDKGRWQKNKESDNPDIEAAGDG